MGAWKNPRSEKTINAKNKGRLFIVATPIGNMGDLSPRAHETLSSVDKILAEDTRILSRLAHRFSISTPSESLNAHNEAKKIERITSMLENGQNLALVSDAGTPCIHDPGYRLISSLHEKKISISPVPGPSSAIAALSCSGFYADKFNFRGYLPKKKGKREREFAMALESKYPTIFFESPYRILVSLKQICQLQKDRDIFLAREITKKYEEMIRGRVEEIYRELSLRKGHIKGELIIIISGLKNYKNILKT